MKDNAIKVMIVDDSMLFRNVLTAFIALDPGIKVISKASTAEEAIKNISIEKPDVITLDIELPGMNGIELLKTHLRKTKIPVIVVSSAPISTFEALDAGAVDFIKKPVSHSKEDTANFAKELISMIKTARIAKVGVVSENKTEENVSVHTHINKCNSKRLIAIGSSTGGVEALQTVLTTFPENCPPTLIVQHMPAGFTETFANRLNKICKPHIKEAKDGDIVKDGTVLIAQGKMQMKVIKTSSGQMIVKVYQGDKVNGHCPSVDVLFNSIVPFADANTVGIILTGMGADGAKGILEMKKKGAYTIGQNKDTCVVYGMPMVAYNIGGICEQCPLNRVTEAVFKYLNSK